MNSVPIELPGVTFTELLQIAKRSLGISRPTVWRYITMFTDMNLVFHDGKFYRRNPLIGDLPAEALARIGLGLDRLRQLQSAKFWEPQRRWRADPIENPDQLYDFFRRTIGNVVWGYLEMLHAITTMPNFLAARELASLMIDSHVNWFLMLMAREVWDKRSKVPLNSLAGKEVTVVSYAKHPRRR